VLLWHKRKWHCRVPECERKVFTEALPADIPARARITTRARRAAAQPIGDHCRPVSGVAGEFGMDWKVAHDAFVAYADEVLPAGPPPVTVLGIDETRRGKGRYEIQSSTGAKVWVDRFDTGLVDLDGTGGLFAQVNGRTSAAVIAWLEQQDPEWRPRITHVSMDTSATYARAARLALPNAVVIVDRFHLVALANRAVTEYRRELAWARRGRRAGRSTRNGRNGTGCSAARRPSPTRKQRRCTTRCAARTPPVGSRSAGRARKCSGDCSPSQGPTRNGT
jgi:hypothetical protein